MNQDDVSPFRLDGKSALITGASSGIGRQQSLALAQAGAHIVLLGRRQTELDMTARTLATIGATSDQLVADLQDRAQLPAIARQAQELADGIDILINAAGVNFREAADDITPESWDATLTLNLAVPFFLARALVPHMRDNGWGRVINMASLQTQRAFANSLAYGASKGGVAQLTRAMAEAWSADGITCNAIAPGFFPTELTAPLFAKDSQRTELAERTAIGRNGELSDLDGISVFLASAASDYITGQVIYVDGGFTAR
jgi:NAD(P)-dependent dehydrogenase (short-subunit alcohol dehydrogenase family)